jgi:thymidylate synthase
MSEYQYINLIKHILENGISKDDRTGVGTLSVFSYNMKFDLRDSFPLLTTKKVYWKAVVEELLWFISGSTDANVLKEKGVNIWDGNSSREFLDSRGLTHYSNGDIGPGYGFQWRHYGAEYKGCRYSGVVCEEPIKLIESEELIKRIECIESIERIECIESEEPIKRIESEELIKRIKLIESEEPINPHKGIDQLKDVIYKIKNTPNDRRIIMTAWNPSDIDKMALPPCHMFVQFWVNTEKKELHSQMYQRSCDVGLGVPFNIASYALLTCIIAKICGLNPGDFHYCMGDTHIYKNHIEAMKLQVERVPYDFPKINIKNIIDIDNIVFEDIELIDYKCHNNIKMNMAV